MALCGSLIFETMIYDARVISMLACSRPWVTAASSHVAARTHVVSEQGVLSEQNIGLQTERTAYFIHGSGTDATRAQSVSGVTSSVHGVTIFRGMHVNVDQLLCPQGPGEVDNTKR